MSIQQDIIELLAKKVLAHVNEYNYEICESVEFLYPGMTTDDQLSVVKGVQTLMNVGENK